MKAENKNMGIFILYGIVYEVMNKMYDPFLIKFLERIGGDEFHFSLYNAIPGFATVFALIPGVLLIRHMNKKTATMGLIAVSRLCLLLLVLVPFLKPAYQPLAFILAFSVMNFPNAIYQSSYQSFVGDLFDESVRARAIGLRNYYTVPLVIATTMICGWVLAEVPRTELGRIHIYQSFFLAAFIFGMLEVFIFSRFRHIEHKETPALDLKEVAKTFLKNRRLRTFVICSLIFHFGWQMGWPLFNVYLLKVLKADENWLSIINVTGFISMFFGYKYWIRQMERKGNAYVCGVCTLGMAATPILYLLCHNLVALTLVSLSTGLFIAGTISVLLNSMLEVCPAENRIVYIAVYNTLINISLAIAPLIGHQVMMMSNITVALLITAFFRTLGSIAFFIRDKRVYQGEIEKA